MQPPTLLEAWIGNWFPILFHAKNHVLSMELKQTTIFLQKSSDSNLLQENCKLDVLVCIKCMVMGWP